MMTVCFPVSDTHIALTVQLLLYLAWYWYVVSIRPVGWVCSAV